jgi:hypothetical protein
MQGFHVCTSESEHYGSLSEMWQLSPPRRFSGVRLLMGKTEGLAPEGRDVPGGSEPCNNCNKG